MNNLSTNKREPRIDALKGVLILLVVLGHCVGHDTSFRINMVSYDYIYLFHMPLFVFMSGYFTRLGGKFWNRVLNFVCIFLFWHVVKSLYLGRTFFEMIVRPAPMMWYLFSLVIWCVVLWLSQKISKKITPIILIATSVAIALVAGFIPQIETSFALSRTLVFAPFFFLGVSMQKVNFMDVCYNIPCWMAWVVLIIVFIVLYILNIDISIIVRGASPYPDGYLLYGFVGRVVYYIAAIIMSIALIRVVQPNKIMSTVGLDTMKYYIFHGVVLMVLYNMPIPWSFGFAVFYWVVLSVIIFFFNKWKVTDYILNPIGKAIDVIRNKNSKINNHMDLRNKKLLMIGGAAYANHIKKYKDEAGFTVVSIEKYPEPRMDDLVDKRYAVDRRDIESIIEVVKKEKIDGIFVGSSEEYVAKAIEICEKTDARFYVNRKQWEIISNKARFKEFARKSGFPVIPEYKLSVIPTQEEIDSLEYPVLIKPVDGSGGRGLYPCYSAETFMELYNEALRWSPSKKIIVEKLIENAEDICVCYTLQDGECILSYSFSKEVVISDNNYVSLPIFHIYPSEFQEQYLLEADGAAKKMIEEMGLKNGTLNIQGFYKDGKFMFYEAGYRMGGAQAYIITEYMNGANVLNYMLNYVLSGRMNDKPLAKVENARFKCPACNYYVELKAGIIDHIEGFAHVKSMPEVLNITQMCYPGDEILENNQIGRAVYRIHVVGKNAETLAQKLVEISDTLRIISTEGNEMQIEHLTYDRCLSVIKKNIKNMNIYNCIKINELNGWGGYNSLPKQ